MRCLKGYSQGKHGMALRIILPLGRSAQAFGNFTSPEFKIGFCVAPAASALQL